MSELATMPAKRAWTKRRITVVGIAIAVTLAAAVPIASYGWARWSGRCSAHVAETPAKALSGIHADPVDQVDLDSLRASEDKLISVERARAVLSAARTPGGGFQPVERVLVSATDSVQPIGTVNGNPVLAVGPAAWVGMTLQGSIVPLDRNTGQAIWGRQYLGDGVHGQQLPDQTMVLQLTSRPMAASFANADGRLEWCTWISKDRLTSYQPTFQSATTDDKQLYVVRAAAKEATDQSVLLTRIDARSGKIAWSQPIQGTDYVSALDTFGDQILLNQASAKDFGSLWNSATYPRTAGSGALIARSAATGAPSWTYAGPDQSSWGVNVIGVRGDTVIVAARQAKKIPAKNEEPVQSWLIALDRAGKERWRQNLGSTSLAFNLTEQAKVAGSVVLTEQRARRQEPKLEARDITTGKLLWTRARTNTAPDLRLERSTITDNHLVVAAYGPLFGVRSIDLATGNETTVLAKGFVRSLVGDEKAITITAEGLIFTLDHT
ncbi:MAG TPA: PQQ-binding-like beta-propeller repeat protein [Kribbella sp.]